MKPSQPERRLDGASARHARPPGSADSHPNTGPRSTLRPHWLDTSMTSVNTSSSPADLALQPRADHTGCMNVAAHPGPLPLSPPPVGCTHPFPPPSRNPCPPLAENLELRQQAGYWKTMHQRACTRLTELQAELEHVRAQPRPRERQLFGRKAEPAPAHPPDRLPSSPPPNHPAPAANNAVGPVRHAATTAIYPSSPGNWNCQPTGNRVRRAVSRSPRFPVPPTANSWRSKSAPTAAVIAGAAIAPLAGAVASQASSPQRVPPNLSPKVNWACPSG